MYMYVYMYVQCMYMYMYVYVYMYTYMYIVYAHTVVDCVHVYGHLRSECRNITSESDTIIQSEGYYGGSCVCAGTGIYMYMKERELREREEKRGYWVSRLTQPYMYMYM